MRMFDAFECFTAYDWQLMRDAWHTKGRTAAIVEVHRITETALRVAHCQAPSSQVAALAVAALGMRSEPKRVTYDGAVRLSGIMASLRT